MIYLAAPFRHESPLTEEVRLLTASAVAARMAGRGEPVFSPLSHSALIQKVARCPIDWYSLDLHILRRCSRLKVLRLPGWEKSHGVQLEIREAERLGIPIDLL